MTLGLILLLCAFVLVVFGVASPLFEQLRISSVAAAAFLVLILGMWFVYPKNAAVLTGAVGVLFLVRLRWWRGRVLAILATVAAGISAFLVLLAVDAFREAGLLAGVAAALVSCILGRFRRGRMCAGFAAPAIMMLLAALAEAMLGAILYGGDNAYFDMTVGSMLFTTAITGALEALKSRRLNKGC